MTASDSSAFQLLDFDDVEAGVLAYRIDQGVLEDADLAAVWLRFDQAHAAGGRIRIYAEMTAIPQVSGSVVLDKLKRLGTLLAAIERIAVVGDQGWLDLYARIVEPITRFEVRHFSLGERDAARDWIVANT